MTKPEKSNNNRKWKDLILKSGIPYEYEISQMLTSKGYSCSFDQAYFRKNENQIETEFSVDLLADKEFAEEHVQLKLHVECKYRQLGTKWVFIPSLSNLFRGIYGTNWLCAVDHFNEKNKFELEQIAEELAPTCEKGIQLDDNNIAPNVIPRAIAQLSYSLADQIKTSLQLQQIFASSGSEEKLFYHIPIIFTTAELYRIKEGTTTKDVMNCTEGVEQISDKADIIVISNEKHLGLRKYNEERLNSLVGDKENQKLFDLMKSTIGRDILNYPKAIVIIHSKDGVQNGFNRLEMILEKIITKDSSYVEASKVVSTLFQAIVNQTNK